MAYPRPRDGHLTGSISRHASDRRRHCQCNTNDEHKFRIVLLDNVYSRVLSTKKHACVVPLTPTDLISMKQMVEESDIEKHILESYRPLTSPDGKHNWTVLEPYIVVFRVVEEQREVWVATPVNHFSKANGIKIKGYDDLKHWDPTYYYGDMGGSLMRRFRGQPVAPKVRFGNATKARTSFLAFCRNTM